jgi:hypothetical protein
MRQAVAAVVILVPLAAGLAPAWFGPLVAAALWGLGVLLCFYGWGSWLARRLTPALDVDGGLRAGWGLALTVIAGGPLLLLGLARRPVLLVWLFAGIALAAREVMGWRARRVNPRWEAPIVAVLVVVAAVTFLGAGGRATPNPSDDWVAYLPFLHKILQTGTLLEPFSLRRMASYGGQSYLQAVVRIGTDDGQMQIFDGGVCIALLLGLVLGARRGMPPASRLLVLLLGAVVVMLPEIRINTASEVSGAALFLTAYRSAVLADRHHVGGWRRAAVVALPLATICTLRQNYIAVAAIMTLALLLPGDGADESAARGRARAFGRVVALIGLGLLPWAALAFRSNHTFLFPLFAGNYDPHFAGLAPTGGLADRFKLYLSAMFQDDPIRAMPLLVVIAPAAAMAAHRRPLLGLWLGAIIGFAFLAMGLPEGEPFAVARYAFAFVVAFALALGLATADLLATENSKRERVLAVAVVGFIVLQLHGTEHNLVRNLGVGIDRIEATRPGPAPMHATADEVQRMQAAIPAGARALVMIERPYLLDFARNRLDNWDQPGVASPGRGLRIDAGSERTADYLLGEGIRYLAFTRPDRSQIDLYSRARWKQLLVGHARLWRDTAPVFLAAFDIVDELTRTRATRYDDGHFVVLDLASRGG